MYGDTGIITKKRVLIVLLAIVFIIITFVAVDKLIFRQTNSDPNLSSVATSSVSLQLFFSQPIKSIGKVTIANATIDGSSVEGSSILIPLNSIDLKEDTTYMVTVNSIQSEWFNNKITTLTKSFKAKYVDYNQLSDSQKKKSVDQSNSYQIDDPFLNNYFPIMGPDYTYQIEALNTEDNSIQVTITFFDEVPDYDNGGKITQLPNDIAEKYREEALKKIRDSGGDPDKYVITYSNDYLNQKYSPEGRTHD